MTLRCMYDLGPGTARGSRPSTAMSREGRDTPMICTPTGSDR